MKSRDIKDRALASLARLASINARANAWLLKTLAAQAGSGEIGRASDACLADVLEAVSAHPGDVTRVLRGGNRQVAASLFQECCAALAGEPFDDGQLTAFAEASGAGLHYSQEGEDLFLLRAMALPEPGFFVDVGAHHPTRFSNTYALYRQGWRGLNIDATPGSMEPFRRLRPGDVNVECAVSAATEPLRFHSFREPALNTFDAALADSYVRDGWPLLEVREITPRPLREIMAEHWPAGRPVHLMSIDVEGEEMGVLRSNDWETCRPHWMVVEALDVPLNDLGASPAVSFLVERGYVPVSKLYHSVILKQGA